MKTTEKERLEVLAVEQKLDELRRVVRDCDTISSISIRIDEYGYDQHISKKIPFTRRYQAYPAHVANEVEE